MFCAIQSSETTPTPQKHPGAPPQKKRKKEKHKTKTKQPTKKVGTQKNDEPGTRFRGAWTRFQRFASRLGEHRFAAVEFLDPKKVPSNAARAAALKQRRTRRGGGGGASVLAQGERWLPGVCVFLVSKLGFFRVCSGSFH